MILGTEKQKKNDTWKFTPNEGRVILGTEKQTKNDTWKFTPNEGRVILGTEKPKKKWHIKINSKRR